MAARYWVNGGTGNWNSTTNWAATSGGASGASVPGTSDDVTFDSAGNSASVNTATLSINSLTITSGYTQTLTLNTGTVTIVGNTSLGSAMTLTGSGILAIGTSNATVTFNSNGCVIGCTLRIGHSLGVIASTITMSSNISVSGTLSLGQGSATSDVIINGNTITATGNVLMNGSSTARITRGTTSIVIGGGSNQTLSCSIQAVLRNNLTINKSGGTLSISDFYYDTGTFTYIAGTVSVSGTLTSLASTTFNSSTINWNNFTWGGGGTNTLTLSSTFSVLGNVIIQTAGTYTVSGATYWTSIGGQLSNSGSNTVTFANNMTVVGITTAGNLTLNTVTITNTSNLNLTAGIITGSATIIMTGTGTWSGINALGTNLVFNSGANTITVSGTVVFGGNSNTITYTSGVMNVSSSTLRLTTSSINTSGMNWYNVTCTSSSSIITLLSNLNVTNEFSTTNVTSTWNGAYNINLSGNLNLSAQSTTTIAGTAKIIMIGTGTVSGGHTSGGIAIAYEQNTSGTITYSGTIHFIGANPFTHTQGTTLGGSSTVIVSGTMAINASGLNFNELDIDGNITFTSTDSFGWTTSTLQSVTGTHTYKSGVTYNITILLQLIGSSSSRIIMLSSVGGTRAYFNLQPTGTMTVGYVTSTDIDSSGGLTIWDWQGVLNNTVNWNILAAPQTSAFTFVMF